MKFLIAGLGSIGRRHLRNLKALGQTDFLLYRTHRSTLGEDDLAGLPVETDLARALDWRPDAVVVANPTSLHLEVAIPVAEAGCHLLLEKPVSATMEGVERLREAVARTGSRVLVGFQFRFHPTLNKAAEFLAAGALGKVLAVRAHWGEYLPGWHPWEDYRQGYAARPDLGGGVVLTLCHPLDYLRWLVGEVERLWALAGNTAFGLPVEDGAEIGLRFAGGALGSVHLDYHQRPGAHHLEITGMEGTLRWDNADGRLELYRVEEGEWRAFLPPEGFERNQMFLAQTRHFLQVVRGEVEPRCTLEDGVRALDLALSSLASAREGRLITFRKEGV